MSAATVGRPPGRRAAGSMSAGADEQAGGEAQGGSKTPRRFSPYAPYRKDGKRQSQRRRRHVPKKGGLNTHMQYNGANLQRTEPKTLSKRREKRSARRI